jgi:hypothetical protein
MQRADINTSVIRIEALIYYNQECDGIFWVSVLMEVICCRLQPELYCQAAKAYRCSGYGVSEPLHCAKLDEIHACSDEKDYPDHGRDRRRSENAGYNYNARPAARGGRIHQCGNQNLTGAKNKNYKERPGRDAHPALVIVNVSVLLVVAMLVRVA